MERHLDPGLQPERTTMAWTRTLVSFLVVSGLSMKVAASVDELALFLVVLIAVAAAVNIAFRQARAYRRSNDGLRQEKIQAQTLPVIVMSTVVTLLAVVFLVIRFL